MPERTGPSLKERGIVPDEKSSIKEIKEDVSIFGPNTQDLIARIPTLGKHFEDVKHHFLIANPGKKEALILIPGITKDSEEKLWAKYEEFSGDTDDTVVLVRWPLHIFLPEFCARQIEDLCQEEGIEKIKIFGISYGGLVALWLAKDIHTRQVPIEIQGIISAMAPTCVDDLTLRSKITRNILGVLGTRAAQIIGSPRYPSTRAMAVRSLMIPKKPFCTDELPPNVPFLVLETSGRDPVVKNRQAAQRIKEIYPDAKIELFKGTHHGIEEGEEEKRAHQVIREFLAEIDEEKV